MAAAHVIVALGAAMQVVEVTGFVMVEAVAQVVEAMHSFFGTDGCGFESNLEYVAIRRFWARIPGKIYSPVGPMVRRLTTDFFYSHHRCRSFGRGCRSSLDLVAQR